MLIRIALIITLYLSLDVVLAQPWKEILEDHKEYYSDDSLIRRQSQAFTVGAIPPIADAQVKAIPIEECGEELFDIRSKNHARIGMLPDPEKPFLGSDFNAGFPNASKVRRSVCEKLCGMIDHLDELAIDFGYVPGQASIKIFEGLRDLSTQEKLFEDKVQKIKIEHPDLTKDQLEQEAAKWISPVKNNIPVHSTGAAVDLRLWDVSKDTFLDMGTFGVIWGKNENAPTFSETITDEQKRNRLFCLIAAERAGLTNYPFEFWHFSFGDRYASFWHEQKPENRKAIYGAN